MTMSNQLDFYSGIQPYSKTTLLRIWNFWHIGSIRFVWLLAMIITVYILFRSYNEPKPSHSVFDRKKSDSLPLVQSKTAFIDEYGDLRSSLSPNLRWCMRNPFLKPYHQNIVLELEIRWLTWYESRLQISYETLKNNAQKIGDWNASIIDLAYPPHLPLPCPFEKNLTRVGGVSGGSKILCGVELLQSFNNCVIYSLGSYNDFQFEFDLLERTSCNIHTYDCTSSAPVQPKDRLEFHQICLGDASKFQRYIYPYHYNTLNQNFENASFFKRFDETIKENHHHEIHILKMDIEGGEYSVFSDLLSPKNGLSLPYQISFESHWWNRDIYHAILHQTVFSQLWSFGYRILQHEYNDGDHTCVEWTLMRVFC